jgi:hypothetical protein
VNDAIEQRAARLLRWYPRAWRARYGEEFAELLAADMQERPRSAVRTLDVVRAGLAARVAAAGLTAGPPLAGLTLAGQARASLGALWAALALCLALSAAMWSQLAVAWRRTPSATAATPAMLTTFASAAVLAFLALVLLAAIPVGHAVARDFGRRFLLPALVLAAALSVLAFGGHHFIYQWPGTGGGGGPAVPAGFLAFVWSLTYWFSSSWGHPSYLSGLSTQELAWMAASPVALTAAAAAAVTLVRRAGLPPRLLAFETRVAGAACAATAVFLACCASWVYAGRPPGPAHAGLIDVAATVLLAAALATACRARHTALRTLRLASRSQ